MTREDAERLLSDMNAMFDRAINTGRTERAAAIRDCIECVEWWTERTVQPLPAPPEVQK